MRRAGPAAVEADAGRGAGAELPFHGMFVPVIAVPDAVQLADQPWVNDCPLGRVNRRVHDVHGSPVLVRVMLAVKPPTPGLPSTAAVVRDVARRCGERRQGREQRRRPPRPPHRPLPGPADAGRSDSSRVSCLFFLLFACRQNELLWRGVHGVEGRVTVPLTRRGQVSEPAERRWTGACRTGTTTTCPSGGHRRAQQRNAASPCRVADTPRALAGPLATGSLAIVASLAWEGSHDKGAAGRGSVSAGRAR